MLDSLGRTLDSLGRTLDPLGPTLDWLGLTFDALCLWLGAARHLAAVYFVQIRMLPQGSRSRVPRYCGGTLAAV